MGPATVIHHSMRLQNMILLRTSLIEIHDTLHMAQKLDSVPRFPAVRKSTGVRMAL